MRYYTKVIEKEKEVLLRFLEASKEHVQLRDKVNLAPMQTKLLKNNEIKRKTKKNKRKHSSSTKIKNISRAVGGEDGENRTHYVSKIVVDDTTQSLKLSFKPCNVKKSSFNDEEERNERARPRKLKRPRRVCQPEITNTVEKRVVTSSEDKMVVSVYNKD